PRGVLLASSSPPLALSVPYAPTTIFAPARWMLPPEPAPPAPRPDSPSAVIAPAITIFAAPPTAAAPPPCPPRRVPCAAPPLPRSNGAVMEPYVALVVPVSAPPTPAYDAE